MNKAVEIFKVRKFDKWARAEGVADASLCKAIDEMKAGLFDADLGGGLFKKRVARIGQGKSGGYRTMIATNKQDRWVFLYGFPKSSRGNIETREEKALKVLARRYLDLPVPSLRAAVEDGILIGVEGHGQKEI